MLAPLLAHIARYVSLTAAEAELLEAYVVPHTLERRAHLLREGEVCTATYFVVSGCLRTYFLTEKGVEHTLQFAIENWWLTDYASLDAHAPSAFFLQAVEPTWVLVLEQRGQEELFGRVPQLERYFRLVLQRGAAAAQHRVKLLYSLSGEARYRQFASLFPAFVQRVPQYMLASYLGFTPEFLSKIRARMGE
ncbi:Crp/Fnr family transcriptional regulator [Hymenobacter sp. 15J16-1T3B]|uniref:Crp/Fnr family transcriptional regulator n=1 Tax=Hymenobacter sp. 15J16-1T3B TaxID=2886941 RepID=UPI001D11CDA8|nr:Crp/Fnr family transcriptional regulator [Hymenobacter sp. 15J16-1T3B]MCC3157988.1 Crp/Fnr family transcriptional regulator [Hymenobacter sp. 15J16-1T3B]